MMTLGTCQGHSGLSAGELGSWDLLPLLLAGVGVRAVPSWCLSPWPLARDPSFLLGCRVSRWLKTKGNQVALPDRSVLRPRVSMDSFAVQILCGSKRHHLGQQ